MCVYIFTYLSKYINTACFVHIRSLADDGFRSDHLSVWGFIRGEVYSALLQHSLLACIKDFEEYGWKKSVPGYLCDCPGFSLFISGEGLSEWLKRFSNLSSCCLSLQLLRSWVCTAKPGTELPWETLVPTILTFECAQTFCSHPCGPGWACTSLWHHHTHMGISKRRNLFSSSSATWKPRHGIDQVELPLRESGQKPHLPFHCWWLQTPWLVTFWSLVLSPFVTVWLGSLFSGVSIKTYSQLDDVCKIHFWIKSCSRFWSI